MHDSPDFLLSRASTTLLPAAEALLFADSEKTRSTTTTKSQDKVHVHDFVSALFWSWMKRPLVEEG